MTGRRTARDGPRPSRAVGAARCAPVKRAAKCRVPKMGRHKSSGQARVVLNGREHYLGVHGTAEAAENYAALIGRWEREGRRPMRQLPTVAQVAVTVRDLFELFLAHATATGRYQSSGPVSQRQRFEWVRDSLSKALGNPGVAKLTETSLVAWRDVLERDRHRTRGGINKLVSMALLVMRWGRARGHVPKGVYAEVSAIEPLRRGQCGDRPEHGRPRRAVSAEEAEKVAAACTSPQIAAMIRLQSLCGMRPGEVCAMRWADIDKTPIPGDTTGSWLYVVAHGKTAHHGHVTRYVLPPAAQAILEQFRATPLAYVFSPVAAMAERRQRLRGSRQTPPTKQTAQRDATAKRDYAERWGINEYRHAVERACAAAGVPRFTPHELRHGFITWAANALSLGAAAAAANHRNLTTTQRYVHVRHDDALAVARAVQARAGG